jgi:hypothetical protein
MARLHIKTHKRGTRTAFYEYHVLNPTVLVQPHGDTWILAVIHLDNTYQVAAYFPRCQDARTVARALTEQYATALLENVSAYVLLANETVRQYAQLTTARDPGLMMADILPKGQEAP